VALLSSSTSLLESQTLLEVFSLAKLTRAQARKRLQEAKKKILNVFLNYEGMFTRGEIDKIVKMVKDLDSYTKKLK